MVNINEACVNPDPAPEPQQDLEPKGIKKMKLQDDGAPKKRSISMGIIVFAATVGILLAVVGGLLAKDHFEGTAATVTPPAKPTPAVAETTTPVTTEPSASDAYCAENAKETDTFVRWDCDQLRPFMKAVRASNAKLASETRELRAQMRQLQEEGQGPDMTLWAVIGVLIFLQVVTFIRLERKKAQQT